MEKNKIIEGKSTILLSGDVFYNPKMKMLRDISVLFVKFFSKPNDSLLDSTCATGVRGIRYIKEANIKKAIFLDINKDAAENAKKNLKLNNIDAQIKNISIQEYCSSQEKESFEFIDLDPFGSPQPHINDILKVAKDGTYLMVTATDTAVLCGAHSNACLKSYFAEPMHNELCKESGIRILIGYIVKIAATFNFGIEPILSISDMHYMRVFVRLEHGAKKAVSSVKECGFASFCTDCRAFEYKKGIAPSLEHNCKFCKKDLKSYGPFYLGSINNKKVLDEFILFNEKNKVIEHNEKFNEMLSRISNELDVAFFYSIPKLTKALGSVSVSPDKIIKRLEQKGFLASRTQFDRDGVKTTANIYDIKNILNDMIKFK
ncbi:MAG: tRNA (guanine(10)-N(2))-dimethyltransferase [Candidatus Micrarchaeia archaeon]